MAAPSNADEFLELVRKSGVVDAPRLEACLARAGFAGLAASDPSLLADVLVHEGLLTTFQAKQILQGKWRRFAMGQYKVLELIGAGRMGSVYLCQNVATPRVVAVKVLPFSMAANQNWRRRFTREAMCLAAVAHPHVARAYAIEDGELSYIVMEYVHGLSIQQMTDKKGPLLPARAAHYVRQAALGLVAVHMQGLIHRDIEPGNLILDRTGTIKIIDFGLARAIDDASLPYGQNKPLTGGMLAPDFAAPELAKVRPIDQRADIYSLGAVFYFCLTARPPLDEGTISQQLDWLQTRQPTSLRLLRPEVPAAMAAVVERMMAKDPAERYLNAQAVADCSRAMD